MKICEITKSGGPISGNFLTFGTTVYRRALRAQKLDGANLSRCGLSADLAHWTKLHQNSLAHAYLAA